mmetsp:Transcript_32921/g.84346  ORF Transcript_32921/g.84346 Transcript_32921/m.84346 type:complete len:151 (-) Transcript_32921:90-542(-)
MHTFPGGQQRLLINHHIFIKTFPEDVDDAKLEQLKANLTRILDRQVSCYLELAKTKLDPCAQLWSGSPDDNNIILIVRDASGLPKPLPLVDILTKNDIAEIITNDKFLAPFDTTEDDDKTIIGDMINNGGIDSYAHYTDIARDNESPIEM